MFKGGIVAEYGKYEILKVHEVVMVPPMKNPSKRKENHGQSGKENKPDFKSILQKASGLESPERLECKTAGYTKNAMPYLYVYKTREYER